MDVHKINTKAYLFSLHKNQKSSFLNIITHKENTSENTLTLFEGKYKRLIR